MADLPALNFSSLLYQSGLLLHMWPANSYSWRQTFAVNRWHSHWNPRRFRKLWPIFYCRTARAKSPCDTIFGICVTKGPLILNQFLTSGSNYRQALSAPSILSQGGSVCETQIGKGRSFASCCSVLRTGHNVTEEKQAKEVRHLLFPLLFKSSWACSCLFGKAWVRIHFSKCFCQPF